MIWEHWRGISCWATEWCQAAVSTEQLGRAELVFGRPVFIFVCVTSWPHGNSRATQIENRNVVNDSDTCV